MAEQKWKKAECYECGAEFEYQDIKDVEMKDVYKFCSQECKDDYVDQN